MIQVQSPKVLATMLLGTLFIGTAQASSNPFADARPGSRLPTIVAENTSDKCGGGSGEEKATSMSSGSSDKCDGSMQQSTKPDEAPAESSKGSGSQCGGGK
ncbi:MAG: hypothetical protein P8171_15570 [Candidatus Thiodiazotropha sp.]|jgi:hypothetical protein